MFRFVLGGDAFCYYDDDDDENAALAWILKHCDILNVLTL